MRYYAYTNDLGRPSIGSGDALPEGATEMTTEAHAAALAAARAPIASTLVPATVWDWQFAGEAAAEGIITTQEALDWVGAGHVPASLVAAVDAAVTDPDAHARVVLFLTGASQFPRAHPLTAVLGAAFGKDTPDKLDAFFAAAGAR